MLKIRNNQRNSTMWKIFGVHTKTQKVVTLFPQIPRRLFEVCISKVFDEKTKSFPGIRVHGEETKSFYGMSHAGFRESGVSQRLVAHFPGQFKVTSLNPIGERDVQPLGYMWIALRWVGRVKWVGMKFLIFPDFYFDDDAVDIAFSFVDNVRLKKKGAINDE